MDEKEIKLLYEIIEHSQMVEKYIVLSEIAIGDGDLANCQKYTKQASSFLKTMTTDVFKEFFDIFKISLDEKNSYDIPSSLEICKNISNMCYNISVLLGVNLDNLGDSHIESILSKIARDINTIVDLYNQIYAN